MSSIADDLRKCAAYARVHGWFCGEGINPTGGGCAIFTMRHALDFYRNLDPYYTALRLVTPPTMGLVAWSDGLPPESAASILADTFDAAADRIDPPQTPDWNALAKPAGVVIERATA